MDPVSLHLKKEINSFENVWPFLRCVTGELFETEHWNILFFKLDMKKRLRKAVTLKNLTFGDLLKLKEVIVEHGEELRHLASRAKGEVTIREAVEELQVWIDNAQFELTTHETTKEKEKEKKVALIKGWKDLFVKIGDELSLLSSLKESPYFEPFADRVGALEEKFCTLDESMKLLNLVQRK